MFTNFRAYKIISRCEEEVLSMKSMDTLTQYLDFSNLEVQSGEASLMQEIINQFKKVWENFTAEDSDLFMQYFYTLGWVMRRLQRVQDWWDVHSILDYITRIHVGKTAIETIFAMVFDVDERQAAQSMDWSILKTMVSSYETVKTHPAVVKFMKVVTLAFSGGIMTALGIEGQMTELWATICSTMTVILQRTDFISAVIDLIYFVGERISAFCQTGNWSTLIHTPTNYTRWSDQAFDLIDKSACLANPEAVGIDYHQYVSDLANIIQEGNEIRKYIRNASDRDTMSQLMSRLQVLYNDIMIKDAASAPRSAPFAALIYSQSGVGKSDFEDLCMTHFGRLYNKPLGAEYIYTRTAAEAHYNNFKSSMWGMVLDDIAFTNGNKGTMDPSLMDILQICNKISFSPPQASLEDKGRTPMKIDILIGTTNKKDLNAHVWFSNPEAIRRRLPYVITLVPKPEYRIDGTNMMDSSKVPSLLPGMYPDLWEIKVEKVTVGQDNRVKMTVILETSEIRDFLIHFNEWTADHRHAQAQMLASKRVMKEVSLCLVHRLPHAYCPPGCESTCPVPQVGVGTVAKMAALGLTSFSVYRVGALATSSAGEVLQHDPTLINRPAEFIAGTYYRMQQRTVNCATNLLRVTIRAVLRRSLLNYYEEYKPLLKKIMVGLGVLVGIGVSWRLLKTELPELQLPDHVETQANVLSVGVMPNKMNEKENVWRRDDYQPTEFVGRLSKSWAALPFTQACSLVARNTVWCEAFGHNGTKRMNFRAMCIMGRLYVVPHHVLPVCDYFTMRVIHDNAALGCNGNVEFQMSNACIYRRPELELAFFEIKHMPVRRKLTQLFPSEGWSCDGPGRMIVRNADATISYNDSKRSAMIKNHYVPHFNMAMDVVSSRVTRDTANGDCGSPIVVNTQKACVIAGLHVLGGNGNVSISVPVTQEVIVEAANYFDSTDVEIQMPNLDKQLFTTEISQKCTARYIPEGTLEVFGSFEGFKRQPKSTAKDTLFTPILMNDGRKRLYGPAPMRGYMALHLGLKDIATKKLLFKEDVLIKCRNSYFGPIWSSLPKQHREELKHILPMKAALNGLPGTKFIDSMNFGTSAGFPHNKSKRDFISKMPPDDIWQDPIEVCPEILAEIDDCWDKMSKGISVGPVFMQHLKDEALPMRKVIAGKARLFMGGPFAWSVVVRMALLPFVRVMQLNKYLFECAPGTNATSIEWERIYQFLTKHGTHRMFAGDYRSFDKLMGAIVILMAFDGIISLMRQCGCAQQQLTVILVIAEDVAFAFVNFNGDLMRFFGSNPSGHPLTVIINCIVNSLYMRYCYHELNPEREVHSFREKVRLITYGDDNGVGSGVDWFNHTAVSEQLALVGIEYTMADKTSESVPFIDISEVSFLKRTFLFNVELGCHVGPLDEDSIWKSLMICVPSGEISFQRQCMDIVRSAVGEWFFYGRERFEIEIQYLKRIVEAAELSCYIDLNTFLSWDDLKKRFIEASEDYLLTEPETTLDILGPCEWIAPN